MKTNFTLLISALFLVANVSAQTFIGHFSGSFGILNPKARIQYELPFKNRCSVGANLNYYFVNWKGPVIEPFIRLYGKNENRTEGLFGQFKLVYGNLSTLNYPAYSYVIENRRWSTWGVGMAFGYKFLVGKKFTIEQILGVRYLSPPVYRYINSDGLNTPEQTGNAIGEGIGWYITTGLPLDYQLKFGYQF